MPVNRKDKVTNIGEVLGIGRLGVPSDGWVFCTGKIDGIGLGDQ